MQSHIPHHHKKYSISSDGPFFTISLITILTRVQTSGVWAEISHWIMLIVIHCYGYLEFHWQLCNYPSRHGDLVGPHDNRGPGPLDAGDGRQLTLGVAMVAPDQSAGAHAVRPTVPPGPPGELCPLPATARTVVVSHFHCWRSPATSPVYASGAHFEFTGNSLSNTLVDKKNFQENLRDQ